jgi:hypothetical protein
MIHLFDLAQVLDIERRIPRFRNIGFRRLIDRQLRLEARVLSNVRDTAFMPKITRRTALSIVRPGFA